MLGLAGWYGLNHFDAFEGGAFTAFVIGAMTIVFLAVSIPAVAIFLFHRSRARAFQKRLDMQMEEHRVTLAALYMRTRNQDDFGNIDDTLWRRKINEFLQKQVYQGTDFREWAKSREAAEALVHVDAFAAAEVQAVRAHDPILTREPATLSPTQYEIVCGRALKQNGWKVRLTPASGDSGADVIAQKGPVRLAIQCKRYSGKVGNKALQEVHAAKTLYRCTHACVVAPSGFTKQALYEANGLNIDLLHHAELVARAESLLSHATKNRNLSASG
ncbi:hypothetical protein GCM10011342_17270 [Aquisalinus flavus]|uniref:Restriction endonuclease type IV Mrr domain-containing protein n=2 Tax=Aquisalinus flavus TaxID=1526572 RepID=A0A8J2V2Y4_9PROT|nr:hypothetical protein GCM10011342_17270 [Aquisalinus flavus]